MAKKNPEERETAKVAAELYRIAKEKGGSLQLLRPIDVVDEARDESSPLHKHFEWDDTTAAEQHRLWQARQLISVCVTMIPREDRDKPPIVVRLFPSLSTDRGRKDGGYRPLNVILAKPELRNQLLADALAEMERFEAKYQGILELTEAFSGMKLSAAKIKQTLETIAV